MTRFFPSAPFAPRLISALLAAFVLSGCGDEAPRAGKPVDGIPVPELPKGRPESSDRAQQTLVTAFALALKSGEGIEQMSLVHPALLAGWSGYGPYPACAAPTTVKLPSPSAAAVAEYFRYRGWGRTSGTFGEVRAWAVLDRPCGKETAWKSAVVWIVQANGGWRVIRYETDAQWYTGP